MRQERNLDNSAGFDRACQIANESFTRMWKLSGFGIDKSQELFASFLLRAETSKHAGRNGHRSWFLHTTHRHAEMPKVEDVS